MRNPKPLVSVITPAYNAERFLRDAVQSVLRQTWTELEHIIADDGSTDRTGVIADELAASDSRVRVVHKTNGGISSARNAALSIARGELICFLDADDVLLPDKIERQVEFLDLFPSCDLVYSDHYYGDDRLTPRLLMSRRPPFTIEELLTFRNWFAPFSPLIRARFVAEVGLFDEKLAASEDWDYWIRASQRGSLCYLPGAVGVYRAHPSQFHKNWARQRVNIDLVIRKHHLPGTAKRGNGQARLAMMTAQRSWAEGDYVTMAVHLLRFGWLARSRRRRKQFAAAFREVS